MLMRKNKGFGRNAIYEDYDLMSICVVDGSIIIGEGSQIRARIGGLGKDKKGIVQFIFFRSFVG